MMLNKDILAGCFWKKALCWNSDLVESMYLYKIATGSLQGYKESP